MDDVQLISHTIRIAGQSYPVKLTPEEKEIALVIEKELNEKINEYRIKYTVGTTQDILAMLLITYAFDVKSNNYQEPTIEEANARIEKLIKMISEHSSSQE